MRRLREKGLDSFAEKGVGCRAWVIHNVAVAPPGCKMAEGGATVARDMSGFLPVKHVDDWRITAQAWGLVDDIEAAFAAVGLPSAGSAPERMAARG